MGKQKKHFDVDKFVGLISKRSKGNAAKLANSFSAPDKKYIEYITFRGTLSKRISNKEINKYWRIYKSLVKKKRKKSDVLLCECDNHPNILKLGENLLKRFSRKDPNVSTKKRDQYILDLLNINFGWLNLPIISDRVIGWMLHNKTMFNRFLEGSKIKHMGKDKVGTKKTYSFENQIYCFQRMFFFTKIQKRPYSSNRASFLISRNEIGTSSAIEKYFNKIYTLLSKDFSDTQLKSFITDSQ